MRVITILKYEYRKSSWLLFWGVCPHSGFVWEVAIASGEINVRACGAREVPQPAEQLCLDLSASGGAQGSSSTLPVCCLFQPSVALGCQLATLNLAGYIAALAPSSKLSKPGSVSLKETRLVWNWVWSTVELEKPGRCPSEACILQAPTRVCDKYSLKPPSRVHPSSLKGNTVWFLRPRLVWGIWVVEVCQVQVIWSYN